MSSIEENLAGCTLFTTSEQGELKRQIVRKTGGGMFSDDPESGYIVCNVRKKEIKLTPEETVRQLYVLFLLKSGIPRNTLTLEYPIQIGSAACRGDIVYQKYPNSEIPDIIIECKTPGAAQQKQIDQLKGYLVVTGCTFGVYMNGSIIKYFKKVGPNDFEETNSVPYGFPDLLGTRSFSLLSRIRMAMDTGSADENDRSSSRRYNSTSKSSNYGEYSSSKSSRTSRSSKQSSNKRKSKDGLPQLMAKFLFRAVLLFMLVLILGNMSLQYKQEGAAQASAICENSRLILIFIGVYIYLPYTAIRYLLQGIGIVKRDSLAKRYSVPSTRKNRLFSNLIAGGKGILKTVAVIAIAYFGLRFFAGNNIQLSTLNPLLRDLGKLTRPLTPPNPRPNFDPNLPPSRPNGDPYNAAQYVPVTQHTPSAPKPAEPVRRNPAPVMPTTPLVQQNPVKQTPNRAVVPNLAQNASQNAAPPSAVSVNRAAAPVQIPVRNQAGNPIPAPVPAPAIASNSMNNNVSRPTAAPQTTPVTPPKRSDSTTSANNYGYVPTNSNRDPYASNASGTSQNGYRSENGGPNSGYQDRQRGNSYSSPDGGGRQPTDNNRPTNGYASNYGPNYRPGPAANGSNSTLYGPQPTSAVRPRSAYESQFDQSPFSYTYQNSPWTSSGGYNNSRNSSYGNQYSNHNNNNNNQYNNQYSDQYNSRNMSPPPPTRPVQASPYGSQYQPNDRYGQGTRNVRGRGYGDPNYNYRQTQRFDSSSGGPY